MPSLKRLDEAGSDVDQTMIANVSSLETGRLRSFSNRCVTAGSASASKKIITTHFSASEKEHFVWKSTQKNFLGACWFLGEAKNSMMSNEVQILKTSMRFFSKWLRHWFKFLKLVLCSKLIGELIIGAWEVGN